MVSELHGHRLYTGLRLDYRLRLWAPTSASRAISAASCYWHMSVCQSVSVCTKTQKLLSRN